MKLITKIVGATLGLAMAIGVGVGVANNNRKATMLDAAAGDETSLATESFDGADYSSGSNYQGTVTQGPENGTWTIFYGCFSTSSKITGTRSAAIRLYTSNNYGYLKTNFSIGYVSKVTFNIKAAQSNSARIKVNVEYSTNNSTWSYMKQTSSNGSNYNAVLPGTSSALATAYMPTDVSGNQESVYLKWSVDSSSTKPSSGNSQLTIDDITIYYIEQAVAGTYSVTFNSNGGSSVATQNVSNSGTATVTEPTPAPTKSGYDFAGWYSDEGLNSAYNFSTAVTGDITLYAKWTEKSLTTSYSTYGVNALTNGSGYHISGEVTAKTNNNCFFIQDGDSAMQVYSSTVAAAVSVGNVVNLFGTYQEGNNAEIKDIVYYHVTSEDTTNSQTPLTLLSDATETNRFKYFEIAQLQLNSAFNGSNQATIKNSSVIVYYNNASFVNVGGSFNKGDYAANDYVSVKGIINKYNSTIELQIVYISKLAQYTVTFNSNGGTEVASQSVLQGNKAEQPANPTKASDENYNYTFAGWYDNEGLTGDPYDFNTAVNSALTLYAKWNRTDRAAKDVVENLTTDASLAYHYSKVGTGAIDTLNCTFTGITDNSYTSWEDKTDASGVVYAGTNAGTNSSIQLKSKDSNTGVIVTGNTTGNTVKKITITWETHTASDRSVEIFGKNTAYSAASDLFNEENRGTSLGTQSYNSKDANNKTSLDVTGSYSFIGIKSTDGALYLASIEIQWGELPTYSYSQVSLGFSGQVSKSVWNRLNTESTIEGYGVMLAEPDYLSGDSIEELYELARYYEENVDSTFTTVAGKTYKMVKDTQIKCFYNPISTPVGESGDNYVWKLSKGVNGTDAGLTRSYTAVAFIRTTSDEIVFLRETTKSAAQIASELLAANPSVDDTLEGSMANLASKYVAA